MTELPIAARVYVGGVIAAACAVLAASLPRTTFDQPWLFAILLVVACVTAAFKVVLPVRHGESSISVSYAVDFLALLLLEPGAAIIVAATSAWSQCTFRKQQPNPVYRTIFSVACLAITVQDAIFVYMLLGGVPGRLPPDVFAVVRPLVGATVTYWIVNSGLVALAVALSTKESPRETWVRGFLWSGPSYFVGATVALVAGWAVTTVGLWVVPLLAAPLYLTYRTYRVYLRSLDDERRHAQQLSDLHLATIEALALAIDAKDRTAHNHVHRVQIYATGLARAAGMSETEIQGVRTAALLHDIGKLAVPEHILSKPGPLTPEEMQKVRIHPQVGAQIIGAVPFPYPVAPLILNHHERWDGNGYPSGLRGEDIPLGARILCIADYFDALTSDRPYHDAMGIDTSVAIIEQEAGKALDPDLVTTFLRILPDLRAEIHQTDLRASRRALPEGASDPGMWRPSEPAKAAFDNIAHAHREIYALYEIAQTMGTSLGVSDTMSLIASKLTNLVPFSGCALFLHDDTTESLRCRFATGSDADALQSVVIRVGDGLAGWVARNRRPLVNARPAADFEAAGVQYATAMQSALVCPLIFGDRFIGTLSLYHQDPSFYGDDHRRLLDRVCEQAAAVIHNSIVFERTQEDSLTDPLTRLPNTRFMFMHLTRELARAARLKAEVSLLVMDLDDFKDINDNHGHHAGDCALREVANVLRGGIRPYDICVRYAGDEFIVVLSGCGRDEAENKRLELQAAVDRLRFEPRPGKRLPISISVGAAVFPHDADTYEGLLAKADSRMYRDKSRRKASARRAVQALG